LEVGAAIDEYDGCFTIESYLVTLIIVSEVLLFEEALSFSFYFSF
jgi:hypothetical protein